MASRYAVNLPWTWDATAGTKWATTSGGAGGASAPTLADDVFFDANSGAGTCTSSTVSVCRSLNFTGFTGTFSHANASIDIGDATAGAGNIALKLVAGMTYTRASPTGSGFRMVSTSATVQTLTFGGKTTSNINFVTAGTWQIADAWTTEATSTVTLTAGTLNTNGQTCSWGFFASTNTNTRTLTLGASAITLAGTGVAWDNTLGMAQFTMTANTATVTMTGAFPTLVSAGKNYNGLSLIFNGNTSGSAIQGSASNTFANVTVIGPALKTVVHSSNAGYVVTGTLTVTGNSAVNRLLVQSNTPGTARVISAGVVSLTNADFMDITGAGAASPWTGTSMGDAGGNSGITFTLSATQTRNGAGGNWSTAANWTSRVPLPQDNVILDSGASGTITADMPRLGKDVTFTGFAGTVAFSSVANALYGSLTLAAGMSVSGTQTLTLAGRGSHTITSAGKTFTQAVRIGSWGATYTLTDALTTTSVLTIGVLAGLGAGTFTTNNFAVTFLTAVTVGGIVNWGTTAVSMTGTTGALFTTPTTANATVNASSATFTVTNVSASSRTFMNAGSDGRVYGTLNGPPAGSTGSLELRGANSYGTINFSDATNARTLTLPAGSVTTILNGFNVFGGAGRLITVNSSTPGTPATLSLPFARYRTDYLSLQDSTVTGGGTYYAGSHSTNVSGNTGWIFSDPPDSTTSLTSSPSMTSPTAKSIEAITFLSAGSQLTNAVSSERSATTSESVGASSTSSVASDRSITTALQDAGILTSQASISAFATTYLSDAAILTSTGVALGSPPGRVTLRVSVAGVRVSDSGAGVRVSDSLVDQVVVSDS